MPRPKEAAESDQARIIEPIPEAGGVMVREGKESLAKITDESLRHKILAGNSAKIFGLNS